MTSVSLTEQSWEAVSTQSLPPPPSTFYGFEPRATPNPSLKFYLLYHISIQWKCASRLDCCSLTRFSFVGQTLHNLALAHAKLADWKKAEEYLTMASKMKVEPRHSNIERAMESILVRKQPRNQFKCITYGQVCLRNRQNSCTLK